jgi:hypothetical protein
MAVLNYNRLIPGKRAWPTNVWISARPAVAPAHESALHLIPTRHCACNGSSVFAQSCYRAGGAAAPCASAGREPAMGTWYLGEVIEGIEGEHHAFGKTDYARAWTGGTHRGLAGQHRGREYWLRYPTPTQREGIWLSRHALWDRRLLQPDDPAVLADPGDARSHHRTRRPGR